MSDPRWLSVEERAEIEEFKGLAATPGGGVPIVKRLLAHAETADLLLSDQEEQIGLARAMLAAKEQELVAAGEFFAGAGYTGWLTCDAGRDWALHSIRSQVIERDARIAEAADADRQRLWDLVRHQRMELHAVELITDAEYADLVKDHAAVGRLETYDSQRARIAELEAALKTISELDASFEKSPVQAAVEIARAALGAKP